MTVASGRCPDAGALVPQQHGDGLELRAHGRRHAIAPGSRLKLTGGSGEHRDDVAAVAYAPLLPRGGMASARLALAWSSHRLLLWNAGARWPRQHAARSRGRGEERPERRAWCFERRAGSRISEDPRSGPRQASHKDPEPPVGGLVTTVRGKSPSDDRFSSRVPPLYQRVRESIIPGPSPDVRNAGEEQHVMLAEGPERDGASQHQLPRPGPGSARGSCRRSPRAAVPPRGGTGSCACGRCQHRHARAAGRMPSAVRIARACPGGRRPARGRCPPRSPPRPVRPARSGRTRTHTGGRGSGGPDSSAKPGLPRSATSSPV